MDLYPLLGLVSKNNGISSPVSKFLAKSLSPLGATAVKLAQFGGIILNTPPNPFAASSAYSDSLLDPVFR